MGGLSRRIGAPARLCQAIAALTALAFAAAGCSYRSSYVAPADGRARVVWGPGDTPTLELVGTLSSQCSSELSQIISPQTPPLVRSYVNLQPAEYWVPRYYGSPIIVVRPGLAPPFARFPVFVPGFGAPHLPPPVRISGLGGLVRAGGTVHVGGGSARGGGSGSGNFGKEAGALVIIVAIITLSVLPAVALGLAASMPESAKKTSGAIDLANAYNDLARTDGSPCTPAPPPLSPLEFPPGTLTQPEPQQ